MPLTTESGRFSSDDDGLLASVPMSRSCIFLSPVVDLLFVVSSGLLYRLPPSSNEAITAIVIMTTVSNSVTFQ